ncbi:hypothetical protein FACS1894182_09120 [Bacteroidia bacterium]|nr:hypothetical protein FACS1894182_09120 [Bacteroidia bacterium]
MKKLIIFSLLYLSTLPMFAQFSVHLKYSELTKTGIGLGYDFNKRFWSDLTFSRGIIDYDEVFEDALDRLSSSAGVNLSLNYNFVAKKHYDVYLGINGGVFAGGDYRGCLTVPIGVRVRPFANMKNVMLQMEIQTIVADWHPFGSLGIHYHF